jgi:hypothetical protein
MMKCFVPVRFNNVEDPSQGSEVECWSNEGVGPLTNHRREPMLNVARPRCLSPRTLTPRRWDL